MAAILNHITHYSIRTIGFRNNNPLNIVYSKSNSWQGSCGQNGGFVKFVALRYGFRAGFVLLFNYFHRYGLSTIKDIICKFAPPSENNTSAYISFVCNYINDNYYLGIDADDSYLTFDNSLANNEASFYLMNRLQYLIEAIMRMENGLFYNVSEEFIDYVNDELREGFKLAAPHINQLCCVI